MKYITPKPNLDAVADIIRTATAFLRAKSRCIKAQILVEK